ncbi:MAG: extracellular solute-binding protein [Clostridiales bacterium]|nr:extracellular solute-binding protein [Clostridiales bacterium]
MRKHRILCLLLACMLVFTMGMAALAEEIPNFNAEGYPICPDEKVTLRVMIQSRAEMPSDLNSQEIHQKAEEITNVHIEWIMVPAEGWNEKKNLMLATGDLPDIIESKIFESDLTRYGPEGTFVELTDMIDKYAHNINALMDGEMPELRQFIVAPDGKIYSLFRVNSGPWMTTNGVGIMNKAWLDKLGLEVPTTLDEFTEVLRAFKTQDPNGNGEADEVPLSFDKFIFENFGLGYIFSFFGLAIGGQGYNATFCDVEDGKVYCQATTENYHDAVRYLGQLYAEGLIDVEAFTLDEASLFSKLNQEPCIVGVSQMWDINDSISNPANNEAYDYYPLISAYEGKDPVFFRQPLPGTVRGWGTITSACKYPEVALRWLDYWFDPINTIESIEGPIGVRVLENDDGTLYVRTPPEGLTVAEDRFANCRAGILAATPSIYSEKLKLPSTDEKVAFVEEYCHPYADPDPMMPVFYTAEEADVMGMLQSDMRTYIERRTSEWIINGKVDEEWDAYLEEINNVGLPQWLEINQAAYDRYMAG